jgi:predicted nucleic acid-binding protein
VTNQYVILEVTQVLNRAEFNITREEQTRLHRYLHTCLTVTPNPTQETINNHINLLNDKKDIPVALGAQQTQADYLITGDKEILEKIPNAVTTKKLLEKILPTQE